MSPDVRLELIEQFDNLNQRNMVTLLTCFEISLLESGMPAPVVKLMVENGDEEMMKNVSDMFLIFIKFMIVTMIVAEAKKSDTERN